jgi:ubiquitin C-terminal hydrolase
MSQVSKELSSHISIFNQKYKDKGRTGLHNLVNSCYVNTMIQCLAHTSPLVLYFLTPVKNSKGETVPKYKLDIEKQVDNHKKEKHHIQLIDEWVDLLLNIWKENKKMSPIHFYKALVNSVKIDKVQVQIVSNYGNPQQDFHELLGYVLDKCFHETLSRKVQINIKGEVRHQLDKMVESSMHRFIKIHEKNYSEIVKFFFGQTISRFYCPKCPHVNNTYDPFCYLILDLPQNLVRGNIHIYDCLKQYVKREKLDKDVLCECEGCKERVQGYKEMYLWVNPIILIIYLKRSVNQQGTIKDNRTVTFPCGDEELDLSDYSIGYDKSRSKYKLYAVGNHHGGVGGGHYTAYCKTPDNKWYDFNDSNVSEINPSKVISPSAYCLFYQRTDTL